ncbi:MAG: dodecin family protein [Rhodospirillales bacterium]|nr:dodecin family protein [Rhodospirillales bacterium]
MPEHVYKIIELAGTSTRSIEDGINNAITRAANSLHNLRWFELKEVRGHVEAGQVSQYQVVIRVGFTLDDSTSAG